MRKSALIAAVCLAALWRIEGQLAPPSAQPAAPNRVLELDGKGSYVELPPNMFKDLEDATVEGWVKWARFGGLTKPFNFGRQRGSLSVETLWTTNGINYSIWQLDGKVESIEIS